MKIKDFFHHPLEAELENWISRFENAVQLLEHLPELFVKLDRQVILGKVDDFVSIEGPVHIGKGSHIHSNVSIHGPVIIGDNVSVRSHAQIRNMAYLGTGCVVGHSADIKYSLCLNGAKIQDGTFVGDSILGSGARVGSGAVLANRKFNQSRITCRSEDGTRIETGRQFFGAVLGDHARIGANCVLSPGTVIGPYTWVGSGAVLQGTFGADLLIVPKMDLDIRKKDRVELRSGQGEYEYL